MICHVSVDETRMNRINDDIGARILIKVALLDARQRREADFRHLVGAEYSRGNRLFYSFLIKSFGSMNNDKNI